MTPPNTRVHTLGRTGFRFPEGGGRLPCRALAVAALLIALAEPTSRA